MTKGYRLILFPHELSDTAYRVYMGEEDKLPTESKAYAIPLLDFLVLEPAEAAMPLVVDFGTTNTAAGMYMDGTTYEKIKAGVQDGQIAPDEVNYVKYLTPEGEYVPMLPTIVGVERITDGKADYLFGHEAERMLFDGYASDGFCVFHDIKRWAGDPSRMEEISDQSGNRAAASRKDIIKEYLMHVINTAAQRFKCRFKSVHFSHPVKQRGSFVSLYKDIAPPGMEVLGGEMLDEGVSVLYGHISRMAKNRGYKEGQEYRALVLDCGGGTTDLSTCVFKIESGRVSHKIAIETVYENGDTDFGGNNLTYRLMQLIKVAAARAISGSGATLDDMAASMDIDVYHVVENLGVAEAYAALDKAYSEAEAVIPTKFKEYEYRSRDEYYKARNNIYFLFALAERVKKEFFANPRILQVSCGEMELPRGSAFAHRDGCVHVDTPRWKFAARTKGRFSEQKSFPYVVMGQAFIKSALHGDIYNIVYRFFEALRESKELGGYQIIHLTGQSCKIDIFRDALKEYIPGRLMRGHRESNKDGYQLKLSCLDGAIRYVSDRRLGFANVTVSSGMPSLPYKLRGFTHTGQEVVLLRPLDSKHTSGSISRTLGSVELRLHLLNAKGEEKHAYSVRCDPSTFAPVTFEAVQQGHGDQIPQGEVDAIENGEVRYFVWAEADEWGFTVVPISRQSDQLYMGLPQVFPFESESWLVNFFDGTW